MSVRGAYSAVADDQLERLERSVDVELYNGVLEACQLVFTVPVRAQSLSTAIRTEHGVVLRLPVAGHPPHKVFWTSATPRIEAIFPHP